MSDSTWVDIFAEYSSFFVSTTFSDSHQLKSLKSHSQPTRAQSLLKAAFHYTLTVTHWTPVPMKKKSPDPELHGNTRGKLWCVALQLSEKVFVGIGTGQGTGQCVMGPLIS